jgi:hypothetical protein
MEAAAVVQIDTWESPPLHQASARGPGCAAYNRWVGLDHQQEERAEACCEDRFGKEVRPLPLEYDTWDWGELHSTGYDGLPPSAPPAQNEVYP